MLSRHQVQVSPGAWAPPRGPRQAWAAPTASSAAAAAPTDPKEIMAAKRAAYREEQGLPDVKWACFEEQRKRFRDHQKQVELARQRQVPHVGAPPPERQRRCRRRPGKLTTRHRRPQRRSS